jgi:uncharacterized membrane protein
LHAKKVLVRQYNASHPPIDMFTRLIFWPWFAGLMVLIAGLVAARRSVWAARGLEKAIALGPVFFAVPLAVFGAEHLSNARGLMQVVPPWMPARIFWAYFVGVALICAAISLALNIYSRLAALLLGIMFVCFVAMIHLPNAVANPNNRIIWAVALRDLSFAGGAFALAANRPGLRLAARAMIGVPLLFFGVQHLLHPQFAPGVPLAKMTPDWVPVRPFWGYLTGVALLVAGVALLAGRYVRPTAAWLGILVTALVLLLYLPIFLMAPPSGLLEGINYVADTLLFAGTVLLAAKTTVSS